MLPRKLRSRYRLRHQRPCLRLPWDWDGISIHRASAGINGNESSRLLNAVECSTIHHEIFDNRKSFAAPWFNINGITILERTHVQLTRRYAAVRAMGFTVDKHAAHTANTFTAIVVKRNWVFSLLHEVIVEYVNHFQE